MKKNEIIYDNQLNNVQRTFYPNKNNNNSSSKIFSNNNFKKDIPLTTNIFKNHELQKSLSINIYNNNNNKILTSSNNFSGNYNDILDNKNSFLTMIPIKKDNNFLPTMSNFYQNNKIKNNSFYIKRRLSKKNFELKCFNDEKCFSTSKAKKPFLFPKNYFIIKQYRINHDTNAFNLKHVITDYTKEYERNSYKIKKIVEKDKFINKIKNDLLKLKFNNRIKPYDDL